MPVVDIKLNVVLADDAINALAAEIAKAMGASLDASCAGALVSFSHARLFVNGSADPAAWVEIRSVTKIGVETKRCLCQVVYEILARQCVLHPSRLYMQTTLVMPEDAWNITPRGARCVLDRIGGERLPGAAPRTADPESSA